MGKLNYPSVIFICSLLATVRGQSLTKSFKCHSVVMAYQHGDATSLTAALGQIKSIRIKVCLKKVESSVQKETDIMSQRSANNSLLSKG